jgi:transposase-like protein
MGSSNQIESVEFWREKVSLYSKSGGSRARFCRSLGLSESRFRYWEQKFQGVGKSKKITVPPFVAVKVERKPERSRLPDPRWLAEFLIGLSETPQ